jgi:hypothetical protein
MPGWYTHLDTARIGLGGLGANAGAAAVFAQAGPDADALSALARAHPSYTALGAIGPDLFFLLPDFKPPLGQMLWGAASTIKDLYTWWDDNFLDPWEDQIGPISANASDEVDALAGGLAGQLSQILSRAYQYLLDTVIVLATRQYDIFGLLSSGVPSGYDEHTFFWSDMLHYRKTYEFAHHLWAKASAEGNERFQAFALGWMTHLATDVAGHCFVNEKSGGPYRLHWQRHHLVENHIDARIYDSEHDGATHYQMLSCAAMHLWFAFNPDGSSRVDFFDPNANPPYDDGDTTPAILDRKSKWDVDSDLPGDLATFLEQALREVYPDAVGGVPSETTDMCADHPRIISALEADHDGYADAQKIIDTYWWMYHYVKWVTTDYYKLRRPEPPEFFTPAPFPSPPGTGASDPGPGPDDDDAWHDFLEILLAIFAWIAYLAEVAAWPVVELVNLITSAGTYPIRQLLYENLELPLYNAWLSLHWYLAMAGFVMPMDQEINEGLHTLGVSVTDTWASVQDALNNLSGGLVATAATEPSGRDRDATHPHDAVTDPPAWLSGTIRRLLYGQCAEGEAPSEFLRPWLWPDHDNEGHAIGSESPLTPASPYAAMQDATALLGTKAGDDQTRKDFERAQSEAETITHAHNHLQHGETLGDPVDYIAYVVARLTRDDVGSIANFNLDADRGYGYLCWDWLRHGGVDADPAAFRGNSAYRYKAPVHPGYGWCPDDARNAAPPGTPPPTPHEPARGGDNPAVRIRYIDREDRYL